MLRVKSFGAIALLVFISIAHADTGVAQEVEALRQQGYAVKAIVPVFSQLLLISFPSGFKPVFENTHGSQYIQESVLQGENVNNWTQMLTISGAQGLAANPNVSPMRFAEGIAGGYKRACPNSFSARSLGEGKIAGYESFTAVVSCGVSPMTGGRTSESAVITVIKGEADYYTIQWAERAAPSSTPIEIDTTKWAERIRQIEPLKLCSRIPGEAAPYPSCIDSK